MDVANHPQHIGLKEAAAYLGMKPEALRNACHATQITHDRLNYRTWRFAKRIWMILLTNILSGRKRSTGRGEESALSLLSGSSGQPCKPTTPCKCCGGITGKWWTGRQRRGTGRFAPKIYSSRSGLAENPVQGRRRNSAGSLDYSARNIPPDRVMLLAVAGQTTMPAALIGFESLSEARRQGKKADALTLRFIHLRRRSHEAGGDN